MEWTASILLVLCLVSSAQLCTVYKDGKPISCEDLSFIQLYANDTQPTGVIWLEYSTEGVNGLTGANNDYIDVEFHTNNKTITVKLKEAFATYEENHVDPKISMTFSLYCSESPSVDMVDPKISMAISTNCSGSPNVDMGFIVQILNTDNHEPEFNQTGRNYNLPMPFPPGLEITHDYDIWAYDFDFNSEVEIFFEDDDASKWLDLQISDISVDFWVEHNKKPFKEVHIISKEQLNQEELNFTLIVQDHKSPQKKNKLPVKITRNAATSIPDSPIFKKPLYRTSVTYEMEAGYVLKIKDGAIGFKNPDISSISVSIAEEGQDYFSARKVDQQVEIVLLKKVTDTEIRNLLLTLQAEVPKANQLGYTVVYVEFPAYVCPTTTAEPTTQCPTEPPTTTTTPETTVDPCSLCPCPTCPTEPPTTTTTPETTVDPCSLCPTTVCPTSPTEPSTTTTTPETTVDPCSSCPTPTTCSPCECTTPNWTTLQPPTTIQTSTPECNCPTVTEVQCPPTPEPPTCQPCDHTTPNWTTPHPSTTIQTSTFECNCPTVTEVHCPTPPEPPTCSPCECTTPNLTTPHPPTTIQTSTPECNCPTVTEVQCPTPEPPTCQPCDHTTPNLTTPHPPTTIQTSTPECNCPTVTEVQCPTPPEPPTCQPCDHTTPNWTTMHPPTTIQSSTSECNCPTVTEIQCPPTPEPPTCQPCDYTTPNVTTVEPFTTKETTTHECHCPTVTEVSVPTESTRTTNEFPSRPSDTTIDPCSSCPTQPCSTVTELIMSTTELPSSCPPCECTTALGTTEKGNHTQETTTLVCTCPTCPVTPSCPPCEHTTPNWATQESSTMRETTTPECNCSTVPEVNCPTTAEPTSCPPCECTTPNWTTLKPPTTIQTSTTECNCPTVTEVHCPTPPEPPTCTPCECTTPNLTTLYPSTTIQTSTPECNCPTVTEVQCPTPPEPPTCQPCDYTTPNWTTIHPPTTIQTSTPECNCPTVTEVQCPTPPEPPTCSPCECTTPNLTTPHPPTTIQTSTPECNCPTVTEVQCPTPPEPPTCQPCDHTTPNWTTPHPPTTIQTSTPECNCPTVTEIQCPPTPESPTCQPCDYTTPNVTTVEPFTSKETTTHECNCPTVTMPTCPPCECTTPTMETSSHECNCPTFSDNTSTNELITCSPGECTTETLTTVGTASSKITDTTIDPCSLCPTHTTSITSCAPCDCENSTTPLPSTMPHTPEVTCTPCPEVCPSTQTTPESNYTTDSHSNPTDHTKTSAGTHSTGHGSAGTPGTTTPGSSHSKTTSSSWFSHSTPSGTSSTSECDCSNCLQVCTSTQTTPESNYTTGSHSNSTDHTKTSAGTHSTGHGSAGTPGTTTPGSSHSETTSSSWFSHSTPSGTSSTSECDCSNCPQVSCTPCDNGNGTTPMASTMPHTPEVTCTPCPEVCTSTQTTPESIYTTGSHPNSTDHTKTSAGTHSTGHGSAGTPGTTTPGSSHSKTTSSSWFSHSTPSGTSSTCECDCSNCPQVCTSTQTTPESNYTTGSHSNSTDHTKTSAGTHSTGHGSAGTPGTTTPGTSHSNTTSSSWSSSTPNGTSSTPECNCPTSPEVTSTHTTTDDHHTANSHYSSFIPTHQTRSSGGTLSTGHGSSVIPGSTTPGLNSPSQSGTTFSSWFSRSTPSGSSPTTNCPTCPECPGTATPPPKDGYLSFTVDTFVQQIMAGDVGHIAWVVAKPHPPEIINYGPIKYGFDDLDDDLKDILKITDDGELLSLSTIEPNKYTFSVNAEIPGLTKVATAKFILIVSLVGFCDNGTDVGVIFPVGFISTSVTENHNSTVHTFSLPMDFDCSWPVIETPDIGKVSIVQMGLTIAIHVDAIDREDEIFKGATTPSVLAEIHALCKKVNESYHSSFSNEDEADLFINHGTLAVLIHVRDVNDCPPEFDSQKMVVGYPEKEIADKERPPFMGVATAQDKDVGENAMIAYSVAGTFEVIIDSKSGHFYPHPNYFQYESISFKIIASDKDHSNVLEVLVKILTPKYITVLGIEGATLEDVPRLTTLISDNTGLQIGVISAQVEKVNLKKEKRRLKNYFLTEEIISNDDAFAETQDKDDTLFLRLVVYALNGSDPVSVDQFNSSVFEISDASNWKLQDYSAEVGAVSASDSGSEGLLAAVIAVSTILGLLLLGIVAFVAYRKRRGARDRGSGSLEKVLVHENSGSDNSSIEEGKDNGSVVFESDTDKVDKDEFPDGEAFTPERKKSVAFAEEPEVIPSEEELEAMPVEGDKKDDTPEDGDNLEDIRM